MNLRKIFASFLLLGLLVVPSITLAQASSLDSVLESLSQQLNQIYSIVSGLRADQLGAVNIATTSGVGVYYDSNSSNVNVSVDNEASSGSTNVDNSTVFVNTSSVICPKDLYTCPGTNISVSRTGPDCQFVCPTSPIFVNTVSDSGLGNVDVANFNEGSETWPVASSKNINWERWGNIPRVHVSVCMTGDKEGCFYAKKNIRNIGRATNVRLGSNITSTQAYVKVQNASNSKQFAVSRTFAVGNAVVLSKPRLNSYATWLIPGATRILRWNRKAFNNGTGLVEVWACPEGTGLAPTFNNSACVRLSPDSNLRNTGSLRLALSVNDSRLFTGKWRIYLRGVGVANDSGAGFTLPVKLISKANPSETIKPEVAPSAEEPTFTVNGVGPGGTVILENRDYGYKVSVVNPSKVNCSVRSKAIKTNVRTSESMDLPGSNPTAYPGFYFPKNVSTDDDLVTLNCSGYPKKTIAVKIKPKIQEGSFSASRNGNNIEYRWRTSSGAKADAPDSSLVCQIRQNNKYYQTNGTPNPLAPSATVSDTLSNVSNNHGSKITGKTQFKSVVGPCKTNNITVRQYCVIDAYISCTSKNGLSSDEVRASYNLDLANHY